MSEEHVALSVANDIKALALINIRDIFQFMITATDDEIIARYRSEERAVDIADRYLDIGMKVSMLEHSPSGWSMQYSMPIKNSDERREYTAYFYDKIAEQEPVKAEQEAEKTSAPAPVKKISKPKKDVDWAKARVLRNAGWSYEKIGDELNVSTQTVINHLRKEGSKE